MSQLPNSPARRRRARLAAPLAVLAVTALTLAGAAAATTDTFNTPFAITGSNPCTGEALAGSAVLHLVVSGTESGGGMVRSHIEANLQNAKAVALLTGATYVAPYSETHSLGFDTTDGAPFIETIEIDALMVRQGEDGTLFPDDDFHLHFLAHVTVDANGTPTAENFTVTERCE